jgi:hypothetical protein
MLEELHMNRRMWLWAALVVVPAVVAGGLAFASSQRVYTCPLTGEELPCPKCCPLNGDNGQAAPDVKGEGAASAEGGYVCPLTGERLGCPNCCPLNKAGK